MKKAFFFLTVPLLHGTGLRGMLAISSFFFLTVSLLLVSGCNESETRKKYFEIVYQEPLCESKTCFDEILALDDGLAFLKQRVQGGDFNVSFCSATGEKMEELFSFLEENLKESRLAECNACASYHLFYYNGKTPMYRSIPVSEQEFEGEFYKKAKTMCANERSAELIHVVYGKKNNFTDYHIFSNNIIVFERFGLREGELLESSVSEISSIEFSKLRSLIPGEFFSTYSENTCPANGYFYGYVEAVIGGKHAHSFTCGGNDSAGKAFTGILGRLSK